MMAKTVTMLFTVFNLHPLAHASQNKYLLNSEYREETKGGLSTRKCPQWAVSKWLSPCTVSGFPHWCFRWPCRTNEAFTCLELFCQVLIPWGETLYFHYLCILVCVFKRFNFKIYPLSKLQVNNTVLFTVVTSLYIRAPEIIHFHNQNFVPFCQHHPIPPYLSLWQQQKFLLVMGTERRKKKVWIA